MINQKYSTWVSLLFKPVSSQRQTQLFNSYDLLKKINSFIVFVTLFYF